MIDTHLHADHLSAGRALAEGVGALEDEGAAPDLYLFTDADTFRVNRENADQHLTFGYGPHVCPGAALARAEARIAIAAFLEKREPDFTNLPSSG